MLDLSKRIEAITRELAGTLSIVETPGELEVSDTLHSIMADMDYYRAHPELLYFVECEGDLYGRKILVAELQGEKSDNKDTVVLMGHTDTVGISDYGPLKEFATKPDELLKRLAELRLTEEARMDLESGHYMFGRGVFDMKGGVATIVALMEQVSENIADFDGNIVFGAVCDEEGNSTGMINLVPHLNTLAEDKGYHYLAMIDPDYIAPAYPGDKNKYLYVGTVGKIMPSFLIVGKETHVGEAFDGLDPNQVAAKITDRINLNPEFCDMAEGELTLPPISLKQRDLKTEYSVQIANQAILFFSYATHQITPDQVLNQMMLAAQECFEQVVTDLNERYKRFCEMSGREVGALPWVARTISYSMLYDQVKAELGEELDELLQDYQQHLLKDERYDLRDKSMKVVEYLHSLWQDKDPVIITFFTPPYYPHVYVDDQNPKDIKLRRAVSKAIETVQPEFEDYPLVEKKFLPCISDLSYARAPKDPMVIEKLQRNTPGYGAFYELPLAAMQQLDLPVADIGCFGKDAHKFTERIEIRPSFEMTPALLYHTILNLLDQDA